PPPQPQPPQQHPQPPPPQPVYEISDEEDSANEPEPPVKKRKNASDLKERLSMLDGSFRATMATGGFDSNASIAAALEAIVGTASTAGDYAAFSEMSVARKIANECSSYNLPVSETQRFILEHLGEEPTGNILPSALAKRIQNAAVTHNKLATDNKKSNKKLPGNVPNSGPTGCKHCKRTDVPKHSDKSCQ
ncbi:hypothetical protein HDU79_002351, partial [Rhizoclosmatium sp. JEL0117]